MPIFNKIPRILIIIRIGRVIRVLNVLVHLVYVLYDLEEERKVLKKFVYLLVNFKLIVKDKKLNKEIRIHQISKLHKMDLHKAVTVLLNNQVQ